MSFGVQEATLYQMKDLEARLPDYDYVGVGRDDGATKGEFSAIFYKRSELKVLQEDSFWLSETPEKVSVGWDAAPPASAPTPNSNLPLQRNDSGTSIPISIISVN